MKIRAIVLIFCLLAGCQVGPHTEVISSDATTKLTHYSRYFENEKVKVGSQLVVHGVITLGLERIPKSYVLRRHPRYSDGTTPAVLEFYFTNETDEPLELRVESFSCPLFWNAAISVSSIVPPRAHVKSEPLIEFTSNYVTKPWEYSMVVVIDGRSHPLTDKLARISLKQLKARYGKKG